MKFVTYLFSPLVFGIGFLAPLVAQISAAQELFSSSGEDLAFGLVIGGTLGLIAQLRGSWIWLKP